MTIMTHNPVHADGRTYGNKNKPLIKGDADDLGGSFKKDTAANSCPAVASQADRERFRAFLPITTLCGGDGV